MTDDDNRIILNCVRNIDEKMRKGGQERPKLKKVTPI